VDKVNLARGKRKIVGVALALCVRQLVHNHDADVSVDFEPSFRLICHRRVGRHCLADGADKSCPPRDGTSASLPLDGPAAALQTDVVCGLAGDQQSVDIRRQRKDSVRVRQ